MGDSDLTMSGAYQVTPQGQGPCLKINYKASGPKGWVGIYWQDPANNWGDVPGRAGFDLRGATKLSFWARGENGGEKVHEFRMGGIVGQYPDSDVASLLNIHLTKEWKEYSIDLKGKDLRHVIGGFGFFINKAENPGGIVFYLDDIMYVGPEGLKIAPPAVAVSTVPLAGQAPETPVVQEMVLPKLKETEKDLKIQSVDTGLRVSFSSQFLFTPGRSDLQPGSGKILDQLISLLSAYPTNKVLIEGHTDSTGDATMNLKLSELRATSVRDYLIKKGGYETSRFQVIGYGDTRPVADNKTKAGRSLNRRVEVTILKSPHP
jgi:outer membrane protein OmpA-like peptidoglycan-associated protein